MYRTMLSAWWMASESRRQEGRTKSIYLKWVVNANKQATALSFLPSLLFIRCASHASFLLPLWMFNLQDIRLKPTQNEARVHLEAWSFLHVCFHRELKWVRKHILLLEYTWKGFLSHFLFYHEPRPPPMLPFRNLGGSPADCPPSATLFESTTGFKSSKGNSSLPSSLSGTPRKLS